LKNKTRVFSESDITSNKIIKNRSRKLPTGTKNNKRKKYNNTKKVQNLINTGNIVNLSDKILNSHHITLLSKGLTFVPTSNITY